MSKKSKKKPVWFLSTPAYRLVFALGAMVGIAVDGIVGLIFQLITHR